MPCRANSISLASPQVAAIGTGVPENAITDESGNAITDESGNPITDET